MKSGDLIKTLADKTGNTIPEEVLTQLGAIDIDDTIAEKLTKSLLTINEAKNSPDIKNHFYANFADGLDKQLDESFKTLGLTEEIIAELKATEPKTSKRTSLYANKVAEIQKELVKANGKGNDEKAAKLEAELKEAKSQLQASIENHQQLVAQHYEKEIDWILKSELSSLELKKSIPAEYKSEIASRAVKDYLKAKDAKMVLENGALKLKRASDSLLDVTDFDLKTAINKSLSEKDLLEIATPVDKKDPVVIPASQQNTLGHDNFSKAREMMKQQ